MYPKLALCVRLEKAEKYEKLSTWLNEMLCIDKLMRNERADFDALAKSTRENTCCNNTLSEPSRHTNSNNSAPLNAASSSRAILPKLTQVERQLLYDNEGCLKCCQVFTDHMSANCPNNFPDPANYKVLTQSFVDYIKRKTKKVVAAVMTVLNEEGSSLKTATAPIATVMGMSNNPTRYMPTNTLNVIEGDSLSDTRSVTPIPFLTALSCSSLHTAPMALNDQLAPLTVPHLYWQCAVSSARDDFSMTFATLIDHGLHTVLISNQFVSSLGLKRRKLFKLMPVEPMPVKMAMSRADNKRIFHLSEWVKL
jgi:hypothetical protein